MSTTPHVYIGRRTTRFRRRTLEPYQVIEATGRDARLLRRRLIPIEEYVRRVHAMQPQQMTAHAQQRGMSAVELFDWCEEHCPMQIEANTSGAWADLEALHDAMVAEDFNALRSALSALGHKAPGSKVECMTLGAQLLGAQLEEE